MTNISNLQTSPTISPISSNEDLTKTSTDALPQQVHLLDIASLKPWDKNARKHSKKQIKQIAASIEEFGFTNPVLIDQNKSILAGHGRVSAAKLLNWQHVPCLYLETLSETQKRAYVLADNQIALNSTWDEDLLSKELKALSEIDLGFDIAMTGFSIAEMDSLIHASDNEEANDPRDDALPANVNARVQFGDIWALGQHRLICGNSLDETTIHRLMTNQKTVMIFTDMLN